MRRPWSPLNKLLPIAIVLSLLLSIISITPALAIGTYTVTTSVVDGHGSVAPLSQIVNQGDNVSVTITPDLGYDVGTITDNGNLQSITNPYIISNINADHTIVVTFAKKWWADEWSRRSLVTVTELTGDNLTNQEVQISVIYDSNMQSDFDDIRFVTMDNTNLLSYWRYKVAPYLSAEFWVKVPYIPASGVTNFYIYFGNTSVSTTSDITSTFIFGDDFENAAWTSTHIFPNSVGDNTSTQYQGRELQGNNWVYAQSGNNTDKGNNAPNLDEPIAEIYEGGSLKVFPENYIVEIDVNPTVKSVAPQTNCSNSAYITGKYLTVADKYEQVLDFTNDQISINKVVGDNWTRIVSPIQISTTYIGTWYTLSAMILRKDLYTNILEVGINGLNPNTYVEDGDLSYTGLAFLTYSNNSTFGAIYDNLRVRHYAWKEPSASIGSPASLLTVSTGSFVVSGNSVTLTGSLTESGITVPAEVSFEYRLAASLTWLSTTSQLLSGTGNFTATAVSLTYGSMYYYRAKVDRGANGVLYGDQISFTTGAAPIQPPSGGGGGGGGAPAPPGYTNISPYTNSEGVFNLAATIKSEDGKAWLTIAKGTLAKTASGVALKQIGLLKVTNPPAAPTDWQTIGAVYDVLPEGATFDPSITLSFSYDPSSLPLGLTESSLTLMYWNPSSNEWTLVDSSSLDAAADTISAPLIHLSRYAILVRTKTAVFSVTDLGINPVEVDPGNLVNITMTVTNSGDLEASYTAKLSVNSKIVESKDVVISGNTSTSVTFAVTGSTPGEHTVRVGGLSGSFTVRKPPAPASFATSDLVVSPSIVDPGNMVTINAMVANIGDTPGVSLITLYINGLAVESKDVEVAGGVSERVTFNVSRDVPGTYTVGIDELSGSFKVSTPETGNKLSNRSWIIWVAIGIGLILVVVILLLVMKRRGRV
jgi:hypothetical protein